MITDNVEHKRFNNDYVLEIFITHISLTKRSHCVRVNLTRRAMTQKQTTTLVLGKNLLASQYLSCFITTLASLKLSLETQKSKRLNVDMKLNLHLSKITFF